LGTPPVASENDKNGYSWRQGVSAHQGREKSRDDFDLPNQTDLAPQPLNLRRAVAFAWRDPGFFSKVLPLALVQYIPLFGMILIRGWRIDLARQVRNGAAHPLPHWGDVQGKLWRGFILTAIWWLYQLPAAFCGFLGMFLFLMPLLSYSFDADHRSDARLGLWGARLLIELILEGFSAVWLIGAQLVYWAGLMEYVKSSRPTAFYQVARNVKLVLKNPADFLLLYFYTTVIAIGINLLRVVLIATGIGLLFLPGLTAPPRQWANGHLYGQLSAKTVSDETGEDG
jgi:hypothetical protein